MKRRPTRNSNFTFERGSSYVSVRDFFKEDTFQKDTDDCTRDICTFCLSIEDIKHDAEYFCPDCGPLGRFLCKRCLKYHKQFRTQHRSVKSFAAANYTRYGLASNGRKYENTLHESRVTTSPGEELKPDQDVEEVVHEASSITKSNIATKDNLKHSLQSELMKTEKDVAKLRRQITQEFEEVQESMIAKAVVEVQKNDRENKISTPEQYTKELPVKDLRHVRENFPDENLTSLYLPLGTRSKVELLLEDTQLEEIAEKYENLYINQWEDAFDIAREHFPRLNKEARVKLLMQILQNVNQLCKKECEEQDKELMQAFYRTEQPKTDFPPRLKEDLQTLKVSVASESIDSLTEKFINSFDKSTGAGGFIDEVEEYVHECFAVCWSMALNSPQLDLYSNVRHLQKFNSHLFKPFVAYGEKVDYIVWPALILDSNCGQRIGAKGVVKCLKMRVHSESRTERVRSAVKREKNREISQSARVASTKNAARMSESSLRVKHITLHEPKRHQAKRYLLAHDNPTSRRKTGRTYGGQQNWDKYVQELAHQVSEVTPAFSARKKGNFDKGNSTTNPNNVRPNQITDEAKRSCCLPHIRTVVNQPVFNLSGNNTNSS